MNKDDLANAVAAAVGLSQADAKKAVEAVFDGVTSGMKDGVTEIVELDLNTDELENLKSAADSVKQKVLELNNLKTQ